MRNANAKNRRAWGPLAATTVLALSAAMVAPAANAGYPDQEFLSVPGIGTTFTRVDATPEPGYGLDTDVASDRAGNVWVWGFYGPRTLHNAGMDGGSNASPNGAIGESGVDNPPQIVKGIGCIDSLASSAYAVMAIDCYGNIYGWGDNTQRGAYGPANKYGGTSPSIMGGGSFGFYKDGYVPTEALPAKINQANPEESIDTWRPIDGPGAPIGDYPGSDNTAKVIQVVSNEYGFAYLKEDGTVWTVGDVNWGARGQGKSHGRLASANGFPVGQGIGVTTRPTQVHFPDGKKIADIWGGYESYHAVAEDGESYYWGRSRMHSSSLTDAEIGALTNECMTLSTTYHEYICFEPIATPRITKVLDENNGYKSARGGYQFAALLTGNGGLFTWGAAENRSGAPEITNNPGLSLGRAEPTILETADVNGNTVRGDNVVAVFTNYSSGAFVKENGEVWGWGAHSWGGAFSKNLEVPKTNYDNAVPVNYNNAPGLIWDPTKDPQGRKGMKVGGHKDGAMLSLDDGTLYTWGENGGGAACGGQGYLSPASCVNEFGAYRTVTASGGRSSGGLFVWPATAVEGIQNIGKYQTISKSAYPYEGTAVRPGEVIEYSVAIMNDMNDSAPGVDVEDAFTGGKLVDGSFKVIYKTTKGHEDITDEFTVTDTGYSRTGRPLPAVGGLIITYNLLVTGNPGETIGGTATIKASSDGTMIDSSTAENPIS